MKKEQVQKNSPRAAGSLWKFKDWHAILIIVGTVTMFFRDIILQKAFFWEDFMYFFYPVRNFAAVSLSQGELPLWNPYTLCGMPFQADIQNLFITHEGTSLGSAALALLTQMKNPSLDFELSLQGGSGPGYYFLITEAPAGHGGGFLLDVSRPLAQGEVHAAGEGLPREHDPADHREAPPPGRAARAGGAGGAVEGRAARGPPLAGAHPRRRRYAVSTALPYSWSPPWGRPQPSC